MNHLMFVAKDRKGGLHCGRKNYCKCCAGYGSGNFCMYFLDGAYCRC